MPPITDIDIPFALSPRPLYVMAKPAGPSCNMRCDYCYYLEKSDLYAEYPSMMMDSRTLRIFVKQYIECQTLPAVLFTWHGGETLLRRRGFYEEAMALQREYAGGRHIDNCIQTNGTLITEDWARFFADHGWLVGVSIDGPQEMHDSYRHLRGAGSAWAETMRGIELLDKYGVMWNALATVNAFNATHPLEFYRFFKSIGCQYLQFTPVVERISGGRLAEVETPSDTDVALAPFSVTPSLWGDFLCTIFDEWVKADVGETFVQIFDATLANWAGAEPGVCSLSQHCGHVGALEHNGDLFSCDHFVFPRHKIGNIHDVHLSTLLNGEAQANFAMRKTAGLTRQCRTCQWLFLCHGECPRLRFAHSNDGEAGHNFLCQGYQRFFAHSADKMVIMKELIERGGTAADVMTLSI